MDSEWNPVDSTILYCYRGSIAHGMYIPPEDDMGTDDVDLIGVTIAPINYYLGLNKFEQKEISEGSDDIIVYDIRKFFRLLLKANPNVLSVLWNREDMYQKITPAGERLLDNRDLFSSQQAYYSFVGYAKAQLRKMFGGSYQGYMGAKRKKLFDKHGYDTKNASHLIRLLWMAIEFLNTEEITVYRKDDADVLIAIKRGEWSQDRVEREANSLLAKADAALATTKLPRHSDVSGANKLLIEIMTDHFQVNGER